MAECRTLFPLPFFCDLFELTPITLTLVDHPVKQRPSLHPQLGFILQSATEASLVIVDEFGKGTLSSDGVGLLAAVINHYSRSPAAPRMFISSHFSELFDPVFVPRSPAVVIHTMR